MKVLIDAVLFQFRPAGTDAARTCVRVLREMVAVAGARAIDLAVLDRGGTPPLGVATVIPFPSYHAVDSVADAALLQRMGEALGADALVSTALTTPLLLPSVQLLVGEDEDTLMPGRGSEAGRTECAIAVACSSAQVCASDAAEDAFRSRFPRHRLRARLPVQAGSAALSRERQTAERVVDAVVEARPPFADVDLARRFLALRWMQAAFELSAG